MSLLLEYEVASDGDGPGYCLRAYGSYLPAEREKDGPGGEVESIPEQYDITKVTVEFSLGDETEVRLTDADMEWLHDRVKEECS